MKIGIVAQWLSRANGGVSESVRLACAALVDVPGIEIVCFTTEDPDLEQDFRSFPRVKLIKSRPYGPRRYGFAPEMARQMIGEGIDVLHVHGIWSYHACAAWLWRKATGRPIIVAPHGMLEAWIVRRSPLVKRIVSLIYQLDLIKKSSAVHILTQKEARDVNAYAGTIPVVEIPNYVEPFRTAEAKPNWWQPHMEGKLIFLFLGRLHVKKGIIELCEAWKKLNREHPEIASNSILVLCGWNDGITDLEIRATDAGGVFHNAIVPGPQYGEEKNRSLSVADFMVLPSKSEGLPMSLLEGFSAGLPALMTDECNLPIAFQFGAAHHILNAPESILAGILHMAALSHDEKDDMERAAVELTERFFSASMFRERTMSMYKNAINLPPKPIEPEIP